MIAIERGRPLLVDHVTSFDEKTKFRSARSGHGFSR